jgi:UDP-MurNAc hydroxylase
VSHLHRDLFDPALLSGHVLRETTLLLPDFPPDDVRDQLEGQGLAK